MLYLSDVVCTEAQTVDAMSEAQAVFTEGLTVVEDGDGFDIVELWGPVAGWSWAQVHAWSASILRRSGEVVDVLDWVGAAMEAGNPFAEVVALRLRAVELRKRLERQAVEADRLGDVVKAQALRKRAEGVEVPAVPDEGGVKFDNPDSAVARHKRAAVLAKARGDRVAEAAALGWVRWYRKRDRGIKAGRDRENLNRVPLVTLPAVDVTLADCVDLAHGRLPDGVDSRELSLWPSDWDRDEGREVDWSAVREDALERDAPGAKWVNADPVEVARAAAAEIVIQHGGDPAACWDFFRRFKEWNLARQLWELGFWGRKAVDQKWRWLKRSDGRLTAEAGPLVDPSAAVMRGAAAMVGSELYKLLSVSMPAVRSVELLARIRAAKSQREERDLEERARALLALSRWRAKRAAGEV